MTFHSLSSTASLSSLLGDVSLYTGLVSRIVKSESLRCLFTGNKNLVTFYPKFAISPVKNNAFGTWEHIWELFRRQLQFLHWGNWVTQRPFPKGRHWISRSEGSKIQMPQLGGASCSSGCWLRSVPHSPAQQGTCSSRRGSINRGISSLTQVSWGSSRKGVSFILSTVYSLHSTVRSHSSGNYLPTKHRIMKQKENKASSIYELSKGGFVQHIV